VPEHVEREFRRYLECGILAHDFTRARCGQCGHDFLIAFSCKGRGVCPSCNSRRMVATAAHLTDHVLPPLPVRQWVLAVPKRLRYFLHRDADLQDAALRLFLRVVEQCLRAHSPGSGPATRLGAVAFIHRFGSTLNAHLHFHCVVIDGV
jgi:DNA-directed RNA polymerase subunit RPC12/RpoP